MRLAGLLVLTYLIGSLNFAILVLRLSGKKDPRTQFSGNAGATNVYRQAGRGWAAIVLLLDTGRAVALALTALGILPPMLVPWIGFALVVGNRYPCFHGFRGGRVWQVIWDSPFPSRPGQRPCHASSGSSFTGSSAFPLSPPFS